MVTLTFVGGGGRAGASLADVFVELLGSFLCNADAFGVEPGPNDKRRMVVNSDNTHQLIFVDGQLFLSIMNCY